MTTAEKSLQVFTSRLASKKRAGDAETTACSLLPSLMANESSRCSLPTLELDAMIDADSCIEQLGTRVEAKRGDMDRVPNMLLRSVCKSFDNMFQDSLRNVRSMLLSNCDTTISTLDLYKNLQTATILSCTKDFPIDFNSAETIVKVLPGKGFVKHIGKTKAVILPLVFKAVIEISILGKKTIEVTIRAPGTTVGTFSSTCHRIQSVDITVEPKAMYRSMKSSCDQVAQECRHVVNEMTQAKPGGSIPTPPTSIPLQNAVQSRMA